MDGLPSPQDPKDPPCYYCTPILADRAVIILKMDFDRRVGFNASFHLLFRAVKMRMNSVFGCISVFFVLHAKSGTANNLWSGSIDISY